MVAFFMVSIDQLEADADLRMVEERVREDIRAAVQKVLDERFIFNTITVEPAEDY